MRYICFYDAVRCDISVSMMMQYICVYNAVRCDVSVSIMLLDAIYLCLWCCLMWYICVYNAVRCDISVSMMLLDAIYDAVRQWQTESVGQSWFDWRFQRWGKAHKVLVWCNKYDILCYHTYNIVYYHKYDILCYLNTYNIRLCNIYSIYNADRSHRSRWGATYKVIV